MLFDVYIDGILRNDLITKKSLSIEFNLTSQVDTASFLIRQKNFIPIKGQEIIIDYKGDRIFGGEIVDISKYDRTLDEFIITCQDWSVQVDGILQAKVYIGQTAKEIIEDIIDNVNSELGTSYTTTNVNETAPLGRVVFNYLPTSKCIEALADLLNWQWYIDANQDVHFFARGTELAPYNIDDNSPEVIRESLNMTDSLSLLKNKVTLRGGEFISDLPKEYPETADGEKEVFNLGFKFSQIPLVTVDDVVQNVGNEGLDNVKLDAGIFDCLWSFKEKFIRFRPDNKPTIGQSFKAVAPAYFPLNVTAKDDDSIAEFGIRQSLIVDKDIKAIDVAIRRATAELKAYKNGVQNGSFVTYTDGLNVGQTIEVNSSRFDINGTFLIQRLTISEFTNTKARYEVALGSDRVIGIIEILQKLLLDRADLDLNENEIPNIVETVEETLELSEEILQNPFEAQFVLAEYTRIDDNDPNFEMILQDSSFIYPDP